MHYAWVVGRGKFYAWRSSKISLLSVMGSTGKRVVGVSSSTAASSHCSTKDAMTS